MNAAGTEPSWKRINRVLLVLIVSGLILFFPYCTYICFVPNVGVNVSYSEYPGYLDFVPPSSTMISYVGPSLAPNEIVEFDVNEQTFIQIAQSEGWRIQPIGDLLGRVSRPAAFTGSTGQSTQHVVTNGWKYYEYSKTNPDSGFEIIYDADIQRVFYRSMTR
jgi:hypothetical protein